MKSIIKFLAEARTELAKVSWPTRATVVNLTLAVLFVSLLLSLYTAGVDYLLVQGVRWLSSQADRPTASINQTIDLQDLQEMGISLDDIQAAPSGE